MIAIMTGHVVHDRVLKLEVIMGLDTQFGDSLDVAL